MYGIEWYRKNNPDRKHRGNPVLTLGQAKVWRDEMNKKHPDLQHSIFEEQPAGLSEHKVILGRTRDGMKAAKQLDENGCGVVIVDGKGMDEGSLETNKYIVMEDCYLFPNAQKIAAAMRDKCVDGKALFEKKRSSKFYQALNKQHNKRR